MNTIEIKSPATDLLVGSVPISSPEEVRAAVRRAKEAQKTWGELAIGERCRRLKVYQQALSKHTVAIQNLMTAEAGKSSPDALTEISSLLLGSQFLLSKGPRLLRPKKLAGWLMKQVASYVLYAPRGVVGIISPWNYPFVIPLIEGFAAWVAGNAVVLKPSEWTPLVAQKAKEIWDASGMPADLFQVVHGYGETGSALIDSGVHKIHFTGSVKVGKIVGRMCGERLLPCTLELGGKAPVIVTEDAPVQETASALAWGAFFNCGQTCIGVERVYAVGKIAGPLTEKLAEIARQIKVGDPSDPKTEFGAMIFPGQVEIVARQVEEAKKQGAKVLSGGAKLEGKGRFFPPTVLSECKQEMPLMREETFGPLLPVMQVNSVEEAIALANDSHLGLNAYVFASNVPEGRAIAEKVRAGTVVINDVIYNYAMPELPFGGIKESGIGRSHGEEGLKSMCEARMITYNRFSLMPVTKLLRYPYSEQRQQWLQKLMGWFFGSSSAGK